MIAGMACEGVLMSVTVCLAVLGRHDFTPLQLALVAFSFVSTAAVALLKYSEIRRHRAKRRRLRNAPCSGRQTLTGRVANDVDLPTSGPLLDLEAPGAGVGLGAPLLSLLRTRTSASVMPADGGRSQGSSAVTERSENDVAAAACPP